MIDDYFAFCERALLKPEDDQTGDGFTFATVYFWGLNVAQENAVYSGIISRSLDVILFTKYL